MHGTIPAAVLFLLLSFLATVFPGRAAAEPTVLVMPQAEAVLFWEEVRRGAQDAGEERGARIVYRGPMTQEGYRFRQATILDEAGNVDAMVVAPSHSSGVVPALDRARARGVPVVVIDSAVEGAGFDSFISSDNEEAGRKAAGYLMDRVRPGSVLLLRHLDGTRSTMDRERGFADSVAERGGNLIVSEYLGISLGNAYRRTLELFREHPDITAVFASAETATSACIRAIRELNLADGVAAVGFDVTPESQRALYDGLLRGVMVQQPYRMGYLGVAAACDILEGKTVPRRVVTDVRLVTDPGELRQETE